MGVGRVDSRKFLREEMPGATCDSGREGTGRSHTCRDWLTAMTKLWAATFLTSPNGQPFVTDWVCDTRLKCSQAAILTQHTSRGHKGWLRYNSHRHLCGNMQPQVGGEEMGGNGKPWPWVQTQSKAETDCANEAFLLADLNHSWSGDLNQCSPLLSYPLKVHVFYSYIISKLPMTCPGF